MITSLNWLKDFIDISISPNQLEEKLTALGLECRIAANKFPFTDVVIGRVEEKINHPNADNLSLCHVNIGNGESCQIVCGAPNVKEGIKVPVIKIGGTLDNGSFKIKKTKLRGETSNGMICSERELGLGKDHEGIMVLDTELEIGTPFENFIEFNSDSIIDFDLTPNRGDCFSHLGVAREISVIENKPISEREISLNESNEESSHFIKVSLEDEKACPRYACRVIKDVKVGESPEWLKLRLESVGLNSVNNIVDIANFVMLDCGHPMHTFDLNKIIGNEIIIRFPKKNEKLKMLDESKIKLEEEHLLICDTDSPLALAGVMGGIDSGINENTQHILIECAYFNPTVIRRSAKSLDISTDSSRRFERGTDLNRVESAINQCAELIQKMAGGTITKGIVNAGLNFQKKNCVLFHTKKCNNFLGIEKTKKEYIDVFHKLNFEVDDQKDVLLCSIPTYRNDITREVDLFEEAARVIGYDEIPGSDYFTTSFTSFIPDANECHEKIRTIAESSGFNEHFSNSLYSSMHSELFSKNMGTPVLNPLSQDMAFLRNSLIPGLLKAVSINFRKNLHNYKLFEIGQIHKYIEEVKTKSVENSSIGIIWVNKKDLHWRFSNTNDFYTAKGELNHILGKITPLPIELKISHSLGFESSMDVFIDKKKIGVLGSIQLKILNDFGIKQSVSAFEGNLNKINSLYSSNRLIYKPPSQFPAVTRDIALLIDQDVMSADVEKLIKQNGSEILKELTLFDLYEKEDLGSEKKSMAYSLLFQSNDKTLNDKTVDKIIIKIVENLSKEFGAKQR